MAPREDFVIAKGVLGFPHAGERNLFSLEPLNVFLVPFRSYELVVAAADKFEEVVEKLADVGGTDEVLKTQFTNAAAQVNPEILVVEDTEIFVNTL